MTRFTLMVVAGILLATTAYAAEGDKVASTNLGDWRVETFMLCDGATGGATKTCAEFDTHRSSLGLPSRMVLSIETHTGCGATQVQLRGRNVSGSASVYAITGMEVTVDAVESTDNEPVHRYYDGSVTVGTGCTDLEVYLQLHYKRANN